MEPIRDSSSGSANDLRARLSIEPEDLGAGVRLAVILELLNGSSQPLAVTNRPEIRAAIADATGRPLPPTALAASGPVAPLQWAAIPSDAYMGLRIDQRNVGVPAKAQGLALIALGAGCWILGAGVYNLELTARFDRASGGPDNQWVGELKLPGVEFEISARSFGGS